MSRSILPAAIWRNTSKPMFVRGKRRRGGQEMSAQQMPGELDFRTRAKTNDVPIARLIGFEAKEIADGRATVTLAAGPQHANPMGTLHVGRESGVYLYGASRPEVCRKVDPVDVTPLPVRDQASTAPSIVGPNLGASSPQTILFLMRPSGLGRHLINV